MIEATFAWCWAATSAWKPALQPPPNGQRVDFDKIHRLLGWQPQRELLQSIAELLDALDAGQVDTGPTTRTAHWYEQALEGRRISQIEAAPASAVPT